MRLIPLNPKKEINKAYLKEKVGRSEFDLFKSNLAILLQSAEKQESEEHLKNEVTTFLYDTYYKGINKINTSGRIDLAIYQGDKPVVLIEAKRPGSSEMPTKDDLNKKAIHELVLYYLRERVDHNNTDIKYLIATDINQWFVFNAAAFDKLFYQNKNLQKDYNDWKLGRKSSADTTFFYNEIVRPYIDQLTEIVFTWFDLRDLKIGKSPEDDKKLIAVFKLFSPPHLLKLPFANDSNTLDKKFYHELLHILGLEEVKEKSKKIIRRKIAPDPGSLLENTINILIVEDRLRRVKNIESFGETKEERLTNVALQLCITWLDRILFLKLLEGQLLNYHGNDRSYRFMDYETIHDNDELNKLFFQVLAVKPDQRSDATQKKFSRVPYLNSSLFDINELEDNAIRINSLDDGLVLDLYKATVLKNDKGKRRQGALSTLQYLLEFLDAYDFSSEGKEEIQEENKTLINAAVLGLIFEKINGYKDGSFFTPGFITMYMCRETIRRAVVQKFNETKGWNCKEFGELHNHIKPKDIAEANEIINSLKICDPAVGSGHFLVSALNELIAIKAELGILTDRTGKILRDYAFEVTNDELIVSICDQELFQYRPGNKESQRVQEALFHERETLIENCLFGVDINPNSVKICRLRLWIELLKSAYYTAESNYTELETLPNIDINIKEGNSLISRFPLDADLSRALKKSKWTIDGYRIAVATYRNAENRQQKREMERLIKDIKSDFETNIDTPFKKKIAKARGALQNVFTEINTKKQWGERITKEVKTKLEKATTKLAKLEEEKEAIKNNVIYNNAFEWRFEFPEVLDDKGNFVGFDVVIGNPPYFSLSKVREYAKYFEDIYSTYSKSSDIYCLFYERGGDILKSSGFLNYITSNSWLRSLYGALLKGYFRRTLQPETLLNIQDIQVFEEATVESNIVLLQKRPLDSSFPVCNLSDRYVLGESLEDYFNKNQFDFEIPKTSEWIIGDPLTNALIQKVEQQSKFLKEFNVEINRGFLTGYNAAFIVDGATRNELIEEDQRNEEIIKPILRGRDLKKYSFNSSGQWSICTFPSLDLRIENYPKIKEYLLTFTKKRLDQSGEKGSRKKTSNKWFETQDSISYWHEFEKPKIIWGEISDKPKFAYDDQHFYAEATTFLMTGEKLKFLLGILNSKVSEWYFNQIGTTTGMGTNRWKKYKIQLLPIKVASENEELAIENEVNQVIQLKKQNPTADISTLENAINQLVYKLYGLTEDEINIVEERNILEVDQS